MGFQQTGPLRRQGPITFTCLPRGWSLVLVGDQLHAGPVMIA